MSIPVLSPELMDSCLVRYKKQLETAKDPAERTALQGRIKAIELFLDNCVMATLQDVVTELKIDTALFDIPFLAKALGMHAEELPKQLALDFHAKPSCMTPEEIEAKKAVDPAFKAAMEGKGYCCGSDGKEIKLGVTTVTEEPGKQTTVTEEITIDTSKPVIASSLKIIAKQWESLGFQHLFSKSLNRLAELAGLKDAPRSRVFQELIKNLEVEKLKGYQMFQSELKSLMEEDKHAIRAFLRAKKIMPDWSDEEIASFIRSAAESLENYEEIVNRSPQYISTLYKDANLQRALAEFYKEVVRWEKAGDGDVEVTYKVDDEKNLTGYMIQLQQLNDIMSPVRIAQLGKRKKYVEKGYPA